MKTSFFLRVRRKKERPASTACPPPVPPKTSVSPGLDTRASLDDQRVPRPKLNLRSATLPSPSSASFLSHGPESHEITNSILYIEHSPASAQSRLLNPSPCPPRRPPRPPSLYSDLPSVAEEQPSSSSDEGNNVSSSPPRSGTSSSPRHHDSSSLPSRVTRLLPKRSMPQLDGVWEGFLKDVNTNSSETHLFSVSSKEAIHHVHHSGSRVPQGTQNPAATSLTQQSVKQSMSVSTYPPSNRGERTLPLPDSSSSTGGRIHSTVSHGAPLARMRTRSESCLATRRRVDSESEPVDMSSLSSMFPSPPPLRVRKRIPSPLVLRPTPTIVPLPPSPALSSMSSPNSTPSSSPTTPTPMTPTSLSMFGPKTPTSASRGHSPPVLRKSVRILNNTYGPPPRSPPIAPLPVTPDAESYDIPKLKMKSPSYAASVADLRGYSHRSASSDSSSSSSSCCSDYTERGHSPFGNSRHTIRRTAYAAHCRAQRSALSQDSGIQWGYAV